MSPARLRSSSFGAVPDYREPISTASFPIRLPLHYQLLSKTQGRYQGPGFTRSISRAAVTFDADAALPVGKSVRLFIDWPVQLEKKLDLTLDLKGKTVRADGTRTTVAIFRYEFRICAGKRRVTAE